ncbi:MAG: DUF2130 domain-containing protein [Gammaproteobacteria bacterium]
MSEPESRIECPNCGEQINVNDLLYHQLEAEIKKDYNAKLAAQEKAFGERQAELRAAQESLEKTRNEIDNEVKKRVEDNLKLATEQLNKQIKDRLESEQQARFTALEHELNEKTEQVKALNKAKADIARLEREKSTLKESVELELQVKLNKQITAEREKIRSQESERAQLRITEHEQVIGQLKNQLAEAHRKAEQGSTQLQGEAQEIEIEAWLAAQFPLDTIDEIKKGAQGADCVQIVNTQSRQHCGTIYYESKRTKRFQPMWIEKFKADIRERNADIGVLVTEAMPDDMERMGQRDGIWVCSFSEFKGLCVVLRESLVHLSQAIATQENKGDKMGMLYDFLTGNEFRLQIEAIVEGFTQMQTDLDAEKRAMQGIWKKREKQIDKVLLNTNHMYQSVRGIAGSAIQPVRQLELPGDSLPEDDITD